MELGTNIVNAFKIVEECHKSADLLIKALLQDTANRNTYKLYRNFFLRWKTDKDYKSWCNSNFILLYKKAAKAVAKTPLTTLYTVQIDFSSYETPKIIITKMYFQITPENLTRASHDKFYFPAYPYSEDFVFSEVEEGIYISRPKSDKISKTYWELEKTLITTLELVDINGDNFKKKIFGAMEKLDTM